MKAKILIPLIVIMLFSCTSPTNKILNQGEAFLKKSLNDPDSYKNESKSIVDTMTMQKLKLSEWSNETIKCNSKISSNNFFLESDKKLRKNLIDNYSDLKYTPEFKEELKKQDDEIKKYEKENDSLQTVINQCNKICDSIKSIKPDTSKIINITLDYTFRAKNTFGAYIKQNAVVTYYVKNKHFEVINDETEK